MKFSTAAIHAGQEPDPSTGAVMTPVFLTSTFAQPELGRDKGYTYSRVANPTRSALEKNIAALEGAAEGAAFASGMAAIDALFRLLSPGDRVIASKHIYGGTYRIATTMYEKLGIYFDFVDARSAESLAAVVTPQTRMIFIESPTNPTMEIADLPMIAGFAQAHGLLSIADNTFATPYLQRPIEFGFDIVMHSVTKYLNGHSDMVGGILVTNNEDIAQRLRYIQKAAGGIMGPFDAWLCLRGTKTLGVRMQRHCENALRIAQWLAEQPAVRMIYYPGLPSHPGYELAKKQMPLGFGGIISFDLGSLERTRTFLKNLKLCVLAESLGGIESLMSHSATMTHAALPREEREALGITDGLVRMSVGIEDADDLIEDLSQALRAR
ncbi:MAG: PLP-dependent aspartate aminotransferase family protein [Ignavibacteriales bacterium]|nr:PLP-dependent aspartate aminotransferase family protein [Ignavibacteriales bacterium]